MGGGPGDTGLITVRGRRLLGQADVVVADRLGPRELLNELAPDVRVIEVGKTPGHHPVPQAEINRILVEEALKGHRVVRLKGGDPYVLGRGGEEAEYCRQHGVEVEVVSGVTSAISVPAAAGIPVTHRGLAKGFSVVTGHEELSEVPARAGPHDRPADGRWPRSAIPRPPWAKPVCPGTPRLVSLKTAICRISA